MTADLTLVTIDEMWDEIKKRNDAAVLVTLKNVDDQSEVSDTFYDGGKYTCVGLCEGMKEKILKNLIADEEEEAV